MDPNALPPIAALSSKRKYATDPKDDEFINLLIRVVEHYIAFEHLHEAKQEAHDALRDAQLNLDIWDCKLARYQMLDEDSALKDLLKSTKEEVKVKEGLLQKSKREEKRASSALRASTEQRNRLLKDLYGRTRNFVRRVLQSQVQCGQLKFDKDFNEDLTSLAWHADRLRLQCQAFKRLRGVLLRTYGGTGEQIDRQPSKDARKQAILDYKDQEATLERQKETQVTLEQGFFTNPVHRILVNAGILPALVSPKAPSAISLQKVSPRLRKQTSSESGQVDAAVTPKPEQEHLRAARKRAAKATEALKAIEESNLEERARFLVMYDELFDKDFFDKHYFPTLNDGRSYETIHADAVEEEAEEAGVIGLPPSPRDVADRSEDGQVGSVGAEAVRATHRDGKKKRPRIKRWHADVAKSGSPADPEVAGPRPASAEPGTPPPPPQSRPTTPGIETETSKARLNRYCKHQEQMQKRAVEQEAERAKRLVETEDEERPAKRRCIIS